MELNKNSINEFDNPEQNVVGIKFGKQTDNVLLLTSIDTETNSLDHSGEILTFSYIVTKLFLTPEQPNSCAWLLNEVNAFVAGLEIARAEHLWLCSPKLEQEGVPNTEIHGITLEECLKHKEEFDENFLKMASICQCYALLVKNAKFDLPFIASYSYKHGLNGDYNFKFIEEQDYVGKIFKIYSGEDRVGKLWEHLKMVQEICGKEDINYNFSLHNSLDDSLASLYCFYKCVSGEFGLAYENKQ